MSVDKIVGIFDKFRDTLRFGCFIAIQGDRFRNEAYARAYAALVGVAPTVHLALGRQDYIGLLPGADHSIQPVRHRH